MSRRFRLWKECIKQSRKPTSPFPYFPVSGFKPTLARYRAKRRECQRYEKFLRRTKPFPYWFDDYGWEDEE